VPTGPIRKLLRSADVSYIDPITNLYCVPTCIAYEFMPLGTIV
jgi:hypothetical protein